MKFLRMGLLVALAILPATARSATILSVDLSTVNQVTISATSALSSATVSGSDFTGVYLDQLFGARGSLNSSLVSGNLTNAQNPSDNTPLLYRAGNRDPGLNIYSFSSDSIVDFVAGLQAFAGSATWALSAGSYADMLAGSTSGSVFFAADDAGDLALATVIGEWSIAPLAAVPLPSSALLLGASLLGFGIYGRRKKKASAGVLPA